jgi:hypothetical protein
MRSLSVDRSSGELIDHPGGYTVHAIKGGLLMEVDVHNALGRVGSGVLEFFARNPLDDDDRDIWSGAIMIDGAQWICQSEPGDVLRFSVPRRPYAGVRT